MRSWRIDRCRLAGAAVAALGALPSAAGELPHGSAIEDDPLPLTELRASLAASPADEVVAGEGLTYTITVRNAGAQPLSAVTAVLELPGETVLGAFDPGCGPAGPRRVRCGLGEIPAGGIEVRAVAVRARSSATGSLTAFLEARSAEGADDADRAVTGVRVEARLALFGTDASETVFVGETIELAYRIANGGPSDSPGGELTILLPPALVFAGSADGCGPSPRPRRVRCEVPPIPAGGALELGFVARAVRASAGPVSVTARLLGGGDPTGVHVAVLTSTVLAGPDLVLPFFEVAPPAAAAAGAGLAPRSSGPTTLLALQNLADEAVRVRFDVLSAAGEPLATDERLTLCPREVRTVNLRDLPELAAAGERGATGYAQVARIGPAGDAADCPPPAEPPVGEPQDPPPPPALAGDFLRIESDQGPASGGLVVATDPARVPRELCRRWSVRFTEEPPFDRGTELVFWLPENLGSEPIARGRIYDEAGNLFQQAAVTSTERAFTLRVAELLAGGTVSPPVHLTSGAIEWQLPVGVRGHLSSIHRAAGFTIAVPGVCLDPRPPPPEPQPVGQEPWPDHLLVVPFLELKGSDETTRVAVRNEGAGAARLTFHFVGVNTQELCRFSSDPFDLAAKAMHTLDLPYLGCGQGSEFCPCPDAAGYLVVQGQATGKLREKVFLSGDFVRFPAKGRRAAGGALVDTDPSLSPPHLCRRWSTRLIHGMGAETDFVFFAPIDEGNEFVEALEVTGTFRDETGGCLSVPSGEACLEQVVLAPDAVAFQVGSDDQRLGLGKGELFGTVEWTFPDDRPGHVTTRFRSPRSFAAAVPGICLEP